MDAESQALIQPTRCQVILKLNFLIMTFAIFLILASGLFYGAIYWFDKVNSRENIKIEPWQMEIIGMLYAINFCQVCHMVKKIWLFICDYCHANFS